MTPNEFEDHFQRLENHFKMPGDMNRDLEYQEWARAILHHDAEDFGSVVTAIIREAKDTFWPALGVAVEKLRGLTRSSSRQRVKCERCKDSTWIEAWPWWSNGRVYSGFQRCPDCGVPEPSYANHQYRTPLTASEYDRWKRGELEQPEIPVSRTHGKIGSRAASGMERFKAPDFSTLKVQSREPGEEG